MARLAAAVATAFLLATNAGAQTADTVAGPRDTPAATTGPAKPEQRFWWTVGGGRSPDDLAIGYSTLWYSRNELAVGLRSSSISPLLDMDEEYNEVALLIGIRPATTGRLRGLIAGGPAHMSGWTGSGDDLCEYVGSCPAPVSIAPSLGLAFTSELAYSWKYFGVGVSYMGVFSPTASFSGMTLLVQLGRP